VTARPGLGRRRPDAWDDAARRVHALLDAPPPLLVVTDFDGTLSKIDPDPLGARIDPLGRVALRRLSRLGGLYPSRLRVFVLSGRAALDVAARVRVGGVTYLGNHGLEGGALPAGARAERLVVGMESGLSAFAEPARSLGAAVLRRLGSPAWLFVEDKGPAVAFHFRAAPDGNSARVLVDRAVTEGLAELGTEGFLRMEGRKVIEVRPASAGGKGRTLERLIALEAPGAVLVLGDDVSDADAFAVVLAARGAGKLQGVTVGVRGGAETPPAVLEAADVVLPTPHDAARLLSALARELERRLRPSREAIAAAVPVDVEAPADHPAPDAEPAAVDDRRVDAP
jgi:trehalose 6-phosphate phosphatase